jgi:methionyl-tRNA formyltransferase
MLILYLGKPSKIINFLREEGNVVEVRDDKILSLPNIEYDCIISYGYRHKISKEIIGSVHRRAINLHISYLPWNRGANPNYWSWYDNTPKGVTIHYIDEQFDTGDIIVQKQVDFSNVEPLTLRTTYQKLSDEIEDLFIHNWHGIFYLTSHKQLGVGSVHLSKDEIDVDIFGWDMPLNIWRY